MKILYTVSTYNPHLDGIQFVTSYLAEGLVKKGHSVDLIAYEYPELTDVKDEFINGVHVFRYPVKTVHMKQLGDKSSYQNMILNNQYNYDIMINVETQTAYTEWLLPIMDQIKIPKILHIHLIWDFKLRKSDFFTFKSFATKIYGSLRWGLYFLRYKKSFQKYDAVLQLHDKDYSYKFFKDKYKIESLILENAAEEAFFDIDGVNKEKYILCVANYCKRKNQLGCINAFVNSKLPDDWKLVLAGSKKNSYYDMLVKYCDSLPQQIKERIVLHVGLPRRDIINLVKKSSIYLMTSYLEAFPISILEAMATKTPYISSDVGIVKYLGGGLIANGMEDFSRKLESLVYDEEYRKKLGEEGYREASEKYKINKKVDQLEKILFSLVNKGM